MTTMHEAALQSAKSPFPSQRTCHSISSPKVGVGSSSAPLVLLGTSLSALLSGRLMRAVNCWLRFQSNLESARQQSKAFAFKDLKLI